MPSPCATACRGIDVVFHTAGRGRHLGTVGALLRHQRAGHAERDRGLPAARRAPAGLHQQPERDVRRHSRRRASTSRAPYPARWLCHYPHTKALAEQAVLAANGRRLATCALRPHLIWGPRDRHLIPRLIERARGGRLRRVGDGTNLVDMVYVENAAAAHLQAADALATGSPVAGRPYFISQGEPVNCWQWIDEILALAGLPPVRRHVSLRDGLARSGACWRARTACSACDASPA